MKLLPIVVLLSSLTSCVLAEIDDHHDHQDTTKLKLHNEYIKFTDSKKKDDSRVNGIEFDYHNHRHHLQVYTECTSTDMLPHLPKDLRVNKYNVKYQNQPDNYSTLFFSYNKVTDSLAKEVDGGNIYGVGYKYKKLSFTQYISDYKNFDVYESDVKWGFKKPLEGMTLMGAVIGKYIHLNNKESNAYSKKAKEDYFTLGLKAHVDYRGWHFGAGVYVGERLFAVMNEGLKVQHRAMSFKRSAMLSVAKEFKDVKFHVRHGRHDAKEITIDHDGVGVETVSLTLSHSF